MVVISELILAHSCAFICGIEVWSAIKSFKNNRPMYRIAAELARAQIELD